MVDDPASPRLTLPPSQDDFKIMAQAAYDRVPPDLARMCAGVVICIDEFPTREVERDLGLASPFDLLGLYQGVTLADKSIAGTPDNVDMIFLYRRAILEYWCETNEPLEDVIAHVLIHEIGHHFGFSDADMERIEAMES